VAYVRPVLRNDTDFVCPLNKRGGIHGFNSRHFNHLKRYNISIGIYKNSVYITLSKNYLNTVHTVSAYLMEVFP
jgi:hypothetical protein